MKKLLRFLISAIRVAGLVADLIFVARTVRALALF
jgi:hypothetical protein